MTAQKETYKLMYEQARELSIAVALSLIDEKKGVKNNDCNDL